MLILSRRTSEAIMIGDDIRITVMGRENGQIRIGIEAAREIPVHREEVYLRIKREREQARGEA